MKKFVFVLVFVITFLIAFFLSDFYVFRQEAIEYINAGNSYIVKKYVQFITRDTSPEAYRKNIIFPSSDCINHVQHRESKEGPVLLVGGSFTFGHQIPKEKTLHRVLAKYCSRPIYDRSYSGYSVNQMLYQLQDEAFYKIVPEPEYIIYTYIPDHIRRLYQPCMFSISQYYGAHYSMKKDKNGNYYLKHRKYPLFYDRFNFVARIIDIKPFDIANDYSRLFLKQHFIEAKKAVDKHWQNVKFIILVYYDDDTFYFEQIQEDLEKIGYIVIERNDLVPFKDKDIRYSLNENDGHPNDKAWDAIVPKLIEYLKKNYGYTL